jgi:hypothetical protein
MRPVEQVRCHVIDGHATPAAARAAARSNSVQRRRLHDRGATIVRGAMAPARRACNCTGGEQILPALPPRRMKARDRMTKGARAANFVECAEGCGRKSPAEPNGPAVA